MGSAGQQEYNQVNGDVDFNKNSQTRTYFLAKRVMTLIDKIERRRRRMFYAKILLFAWVVLFLPLFFSYLHYLPSDNFARSLLRDVSAQAETAEVAMFGKDGLFQQNKTIVSYLKDFDAKLYEFHAKRLGIETESLLWFSLAVFVGVLLGSMMLKLSEVG